MKIKFKNIGNERTSITPCDECWRPVKVHLNKINNGERNWRFRRNQWEEYIIHYEFALKFATFKRSLKYPGELRKSSKMLQNSKTFRQAVLLPIPP